MNSGIYQIENTTSGGVYFGRSVDVGDRLRHHRNELRRNAHRNKRLQNSWNKYGKDAFCFIEELSLHQCTNKTAAEILDLSS